jgi:hypothetical protein
LYKRKKEGDTKMRASRGEIKIEEILKRNDVNFKEEYEFPGLKAPSGRPLR